MCSLNMRGAKLPLQKPAEAERRDHRVPPSYGKAHKRAIISTFIKGFKLLGPAIEKY